jgi:hypothetical protein
MEPLAFIHPGGLHGEEKRKSSAFSLRACAQHGQDVGLVVVDGKLLQFGIGLGAFVEAVEAARIIAGADAGAANIQSHLTRSKELVHDLWRGASGIWLRT